VELVGEVEALVAAHPLRERLRGQLMLALYRSGRQAEALQVYQETRRLLVDELGIEPSQALQHLERSILLQEESLEPPVVVSRRGHKITQHSNLTPSPAEALAPSGERRFHWGFGAIIVAVVLVAAVAIAAVLMTGGHSSLAPIKANSVAVLDPASGEIVGVVAVGVRPGVVAFGSGALWVANLGDRTVSRIDPAALAVTTTIPVGVAPTALAATTDEVWAAGGDGVIRRINPAFGIVTRKLMLERTSYGAFQVRALAVVGTSVWAAGNDGISQIVSGRAIGERLRSTGSATAAAAGAGALWVTSSFPDTDTVSRIDPMGAVVATIPVGHNPDGVAVGAGAVWVVDSLDDAVVRIDPDTNAVRTTIPVGRSPSAVAFGQGSVWVANSGDGTLSKIDPAQDKVIATIRVGANPQEITVAAGRVWVSVQAAAPPVPNRPGGTLRVNVPSTLDETEFSIDPATDYIHLGWQIAFATCAKLLNYPDRPAPEGSIPEPEVARSPPLVSADRKTYTFTIRDGFRFSPPSNQPVTAASFKLAIERSLSPRLGTNGYARTSGFLDDVVGARAYEAGRAAHISGVIARGNQLTIRLTHAAPSLLARLAMPFFCAVPPDTPIDSHSATIASAGPYYVSSYTPKQQLVLERNPNYTGRRPHRLAQIVFRLGVNPARTVQEIKSGAVDYTGSVAPTEYVRLAARYGPAARVDTATKPQFFINPTAVQLWIALNTSRPLFRSASMRRAVSYAIDRRALARQGTFRAGNPIAVRPTDQYLPLGFPGSARASIYPLDGDVVKARQLARGRGGPAILYACNVVPCAQWAQIVKDNLKSIGINVEVKQFNSHDLYRKVGRRGEPYDLALTGWAADYLDPSEYLNAVLDGDAIKAPTHYNHALLDDPATNRKLRRAARLLPPDRYAAYGKLAVDLARNVAPLIAFGTQTSHEFFSARVGCQLYQPAYFGVDLAALCLRR